MEYNMVEYGKLNKPAQKVARRNEIVARIKGGGKLFLDHSEIANLFGVTTAVAKREINEVIKSATVTDLKQLKLSLNSAFEKNFAKLDVMMDNTLLSPRDQVMVVTAVNSTIEKYTQFLEKWQIKTPVDTDAEQLANRNVKSLLEIIGKSQRRSLDPIIDVVAAEKQ